MKTYRRRHFLLRDCLVPAVFFVVTVLVLARTQAGQISEDRRPKLATRVQPPEYFPSGIFNTSSPSIGSAVDAVLTKLLTGMHEPSLFSPPREAGSRSYRVLVIRFPTANAFAVRLNIKAEGSAEYVAKTTRPKHALSQQSGPVPREELELFSHIIERMNFWSLPAAEPELNVVDGTLWVIEGAHDGQYHVAYRHDPRPSCYTEAAIYLLSNIGKLDVASQEHACVLTAKEASRE